MEHGAHLRSQISTSLSRGRRRGALRSASAAALALIATLVGCGSSGDPPPSASAQSARQLFSSSEPAGVRCARTVVGALGLVAKRVYDEADGGRIALQAVARLERSPTLRNAVEHHDRAAARDALERLAESQIVRSRVMIGSRTLADVGNTDAIAPVDGVVRDAKGKAIASFELSVLGGNGYAATLVGLIGVKALVRSGSDQLGTTLKRAEGLHIPTSGTVEHDGITYHVLSFRGKAFFGRPARVYLLTGAPSQSLCASSREQTATNTLGAVAERIYKGEQSGGKALAAVHTAESSIPFRTAVAAGDQAATRAAIIEFFANRSHVVRVRVYRNGKLFSDVGGPHVLAPASGALRDPQGHRIATFQLAIQDDRGYMYLANNFTGAEVLMRTSSGQVIGTLEPGPARVPDRGSLGYRGVRYQVYSFLGEAFPSGRLRISLLVKST